MSWNASALAANASSSCGQRGQQLVGGLVQRGEVNRGREHVVGGLAHVDVVVGVAAPSSVRQVGDHLVGVHVGRGARAGLEDVDRELIVELAVGDAVGSGGDPLGEVGVEQRQLAVDAGRGALDPAQPADDGHRDRLAGDREVVDRLGGLAAPELLAFLHAHFGCPFTSLVLRS